MASESPFPPTARCLSHVFQSVDGAAWELKAPTPPALTRGLDKAGDLGRFPGEVVFISAPVCTSARPALSMPHAAMVPPALPAWLSRGLHWTSSTHSAGNHPMWPRALPSQKPPSPMLRTRDEEEDSVSGRGLGRGAWGWARRGVAVAAGTARRRPGLQSPRRWPVCRPTTPSSAVDEGTWQSVPWEGSAEGTALQSPGPLCLSPSGTECSAGCLSPLTPRVTRPLCPFSRRPTSDGRAPAVDYFPGNSVGAAWGVSKGRRSGEVWERVRVPGSPGPFTPVRLGTDKP